MKNTLIIALLSLACQPIWGQINNQSTTSDEQEKKELKAKEAPINMDDSRDVPKSKSPSREEQNIQFSIEKMNKGKYYIGLAPELIGKNGVYVLKVIDDSPAAEAGILEGDLIREFNGKIVRSVNIITSLMNKSHEGDISEWTIRRDNTEFMIPIKLQNNPNYKKPVDIQKIKIDHEEKAKPEAVHLILSSGFSVQMDAGHINVIAINSGGKAYKSGIQVGDIITHVDDQKLKSAKELVDKLKGAFIDSKFNLTLLRNSEIQTIALEY